MGDKTACKTVYGLAGGFYFHMKNSVFSALGAVRGNMDKTLEQIERMLAENFLTVSFK